ncbi:MAG TPA: magnesium transporter [Candidatus Binatia bacterium]|nr:magnesium transporter [Candidatus Binatia bacterium]
MSSQVALTSSPDRETILETLVIQAELGQDELVRAGVATLHPADIAELLNVVEEPEIKQKVFGFLDPDLASEVLSLVSPFTRAELTQELSNATLGDFVERLDSDDAADLLGSLPEEQARAVLDQVPEELSAEMEQLLRYPADTAGGIMQTEHVAVPEGIRVEQAIEMIRSHIAEVPDIHNVFVIDATQRLVGVLPLRKLILAQPEAPVETVMDRQVISARVDLDQEQVAQIFKRYDVVSIPVVDAEGKLLGRITIDDVVDVLEEEATEDIYTIAGVQRSGTEKINLVSDPVFKRVRLRFSWILITLTFELFVALVISKLFVTTIEKLAILTAFIPVIIAIAGNVGLQSSTLIVRSIALGTISLSRTARIIFSETRTGFSLGLICGSITGIVGFLINMKNPEVAQLALSVFVGMVSALTAAATIGTVEPLVLYKLKQDPAVSSGPLITAVNDLMGTTMYLLVATVLQR